MLKLVGRVLILLVVGAVLLFLFAPRVFDNAGNSLLAAANNSNAQGLAQLVPAGVNSLNTKNDLQIKIDGLQPATQYQVTLDPGQCGGFPSQDVGVVKSDSGGSLLADIPVKQLDLTQTWYINIHQSSSGTTVACGLLQVNKNTAPQVISATSAGAPFPTGTDQPLQSGSSQGLPQSSSNTSSPSGLPNTGVQPAHSNGYDNTTYPRKY